MRVLISVGRKKDHASSLVGTWQSLAISSDQNHLLGKYGDEQSWALLYNLYYDKNLGLNVVDQSVRGLPKALVDDIQALRANRSYWMARQPSTLAYSLRAPVSSLQIKHPDPLPD